MRTYLFLNLELVWVCARNSAQRMEYVHIQIIQIDVKIMHAM